ncbi:protein disulfide-isomerase TMX3-like isoform X2 [Coregonus clupeaformis]|uniref:protein disulfide-isomerase TMX3-like isoform X2 n=1 Tax=Coregonus clupeaformis TaxID=59861 RepID=UPI001E1C5D1F|nr:protein disulfide-isomerase TMX3-like isoform X2 [Coregonus clupeaformis]
MGDTGKLVVLAVLEEKNPTKDSIRCKTMVKRVATEYKDFYSKEFHFGHMEGNEYINGLIMEEVTMPSIIVLNMSNDGYFLPPNKVETKDQLLKFIDGVLKGQIKSQGGNGFYQRFIRMAFNTKTTVTTCHIVRSRMKDEEPITGEREEPNQLKGPGRDKKTKKKNPAEKKAD